MAERSSAIFWVLCPKQSLHCDSKRNQIGVMHDNSSKKISFLLLQR
ncbi:MAG: hypothetical protein IM580_19880 [Pseudanabaena sp. M090S1SP2A07QC]|nr:hypothetical protein [Pseudanabaena sp. M090S1SP2A07QC]